MRSIEPAVRNEKWVICRVCLKSSELGMLDIFDSSSDLCAQIELCAGLQLMNRADLPHSICHDCQMLLRAAMKFRTRCKQTQRQLALLPHVPTIKEASGTFVSNDNVVNSKYDDYNLDKSSNESVSITNDLVEHIENDFPVTDTHIPTASDAQEQTDCVEYVPMVNVQDVSTEILDNTVIKNTLAFPTLYRERTKKESIESITKEHNNTNGYICKICGNVYIERIKLTAHEKIHCENKPHECEICHKRFRQTPQLARHMNSHTGNRPYKCNFCDSCFADPSTCIKHQRIHTNERPYRCDVCGKSFPYSNVLKVHMKTHTGEKPYSCRYCGRNFTQLHHKKAHERSHNATDSSCDIINYEEE